MHTTALVLFSGGQDSTTCLAHALSRFQRVETIGFDYGQRHHVEMDARLRVLAELRTQFPVWADKLGDDHVLDLAVLGQVSETSLTRSCARGRHRAWPARRRWRRWAPSRAKSAWRR
jgi:7-cyano-7-deazaguanine synthase